MYATYRSMYLHYPWQCSMNAREVILGGNSFDGLLPFELPPGQLSDSDFQKATAGWPAREFCSDLR